MDGTGLADYRCEHGLLSKGKDVKRRPVVDKIRVVQIRLWGKLERSRGLSVASIASIAKCSKYSKV